MPSRSNVSREAIEAFVGRPIDDTEVYELALRHRSVLRGQPGTHVLSNERLEFLGDAVLGFITAEHLYEAFPDENEGFLTRMRSRLVNGVTLARHAEEQGLGRLIQLSENLQQPDGKASATILSDAFEAVIGAVYLEKGMEETRQFVHRRLLSRVDLTRLSVKQDNFKSALLEFCQARGWPQPTYRIAEETGPSHDRCFTVEVLVRSQAMGSGKAGNKKRAEQDAAREALRALASDTAEAAS